MVVPIGERVHRVGNLVLGHALSVGVYTTGEMKEATKFASGVRKLAVNIGVEDKKS